MSPSFSEFDPRPLANFDPRYSIDPVPAEVLQLLRDFRTEANKTEERFLSFNEKWVLLCDLRLLSPHRHGLRLSWFGALLLNTVDAHMLEHAEPWAAVVLAHDKGNNRFVSTSRRGNPNDIGLIGGKIDPGESVRACAIRESYEEAGIDIAPHALGNPVWKSIDPTNGLVIWYYYVTEFECSAGIDTATGRIIRAEAPISNEPGVCARWATAEELVQPTNTFGTTVEHLLRHLELWSPEGEGPNAKEIQRGLSWGQETW